MLLMSESSRRCGGLKTAILDRKNYGDPDWMTDQENVGKFQFWSLLSSCESLIVGPGLMVLCKQVGVENETIANRM